MHFYSTFIAMQLKGLLTNSTILTLELDDLTTTLQSNCSKLNESQKLKLKWDNE